MNNMVLKNLQEDVAALAAETGGTALEAKIDIIDTNIDDIEADVDRLVLYQLVLDPTAGRVSVLPAAGDEKTATGDAGAWGFGAYTQVIADIGAAPLVLTGITVVSLTGIHQVQIARGAGGAEVVVAQTAHQAVGYQPIQPTLFAANSRIAIRTASKAGGAQAIAVFLHVRYLA